MTPGKNAAIITPKCTANYNKYTDGVDHTNQLLQPHEIARKSFKWYKRLPFHFLQLAFLKSFLVFKKNCGRKRFL